MNNKKEPIKDLIYNSMDYILMVLIVIVVAGIISWRLNILFDDPLKASKEISKELDKETSSDKKSEKKEAGNKESKDKAKKEETKDKDPKKEEEKEEKIVKLEIPQGALSTDIAEILTSLKLVKNPKIFNEKCEEMDATTAIKYGQYEIPVGSSPEEIIKIITK